MIPLVLGVRRMPSSSPPTVTTGPVDHRAERVHGPEREEATPDVSDDEPPAEPTEGEGDGGDEEYEPL